MALTEFEKLFKKTLLKITDDIDEIFASYLYAQTDNLRQRIIDGINNGKFKSIDDVDEFIGLEV